MTRDIADGNCSRRHAVLGMAAAAGALCTGCSTYGTKTANTSPQQGNSAGGDGPSSGSGSTPPPADTALAPASSVPVGGGTILADHQIVLAQPTAGAFKAFTAVCTHQGCTVASIEKGLIVCPCHGSRFHLSDGSVANGPAGQPLAPIAVKVANGQIMLA